MKLCTATSWVAAASPHIVDPVFIVMAPASSHDVKHDASSSCQVQIKESDKQLPESTTVELVWARCLISWRFDPNKKKGGAKASYTSLTMPV